MAHYLLDEAFERLGTRLFGAVWHSEEAPDQAPARRSAGAGDARLPDADSRALVERRLLDALATGEIVAILAGSGENVPAAYWMKRRDRPDFEPRGYSIELSQIMPLDRELYAGPVTAVVPKGAFDRWLRALETPASAPKKQAPAG